MNLPLVMRALQQTSLNGPQDLRMISDAPVPTAGPGQVLIRVTAAGVNMADLSQADGSFAGGPQPPYLAGFEAAGEVVAVGDGVTSVPLGAHVVGVGYGAFAQYMVLPAVAAMPVPTGWTDEQALGLVVNMPTAVAVLKLGQLLAGQTVLIHAAAGGTGQAAVRIAKHLGARVIAAASVTKHGAVRALGADYVLDSRSPDLAAQVLGLTEQIGADLVIESVGHHTFEASLAATRRVTGRVVVTGLPAGPASISNWDLVYKHQVQIIGFNMGMLIRAAPQMFGAVMGELQALIAAGVLPPLQPTTYALADGAGALVALAGRETIGKLAIKP